MVDQILAALRATLPSGEQLNEFADPLRPRRERRGYAPRSLLDDAIGEITDPGNLSMGMGPGVDLGFQAAEVLGREFGQPALGGVMAARDQAARPLEQGIQGLTGWLPAGGLREIAQLPLRAATAPMTLGADPEAEAPTDLTREALREYGREHASRVGGVVGRTLFEGAADPLTYLPVGKLGKLAREAAPALKAAGGGRALLGRGLGAAGEFGGVYQAAMEDFVPEALKLLGKGGAAGARRVPGGKQIVQAGDWLMGPSGRSQINRLRTQADEYLSSAVQGLPSRVDEAGEAIPNTFQDLMAPPEVSLRRPGRKQWDELQEGYTNIEDVTASLEGAPRLAGGAKLLEEFANHKNLIDAEAARDRADTRKLTQLKPDDPNFMAPDEFQAYKNASYQRQGQMQKALQVGVHDALEELRDAPFPKLKAKVDPTGKITYAAEDVAAKDLMDTAIGRIRGDVFRNRDLAKNIEGVWEPVDEAAHEAMAGAQDQFYRTGRAAVAATAGRLHEDIIGALPGGLDEAAQKYIEGAVTTYRDQSTALLRLTAPLEERLGPVSDEARSFIANQAPQLQGATRKVQVLHNRVSTTATSILREAYNPQTGVSPTVVGSVNDRVEAALRNSKTLTRALDDVDQLWKRQGLPGRAADIQTVKGLLVENIPHGDVLRPGDWQQLALNRWSKALGPAYGVNPPSPWLTWLSSVMNIWRGTALLSPRFHAANYVFGLFANDRAGVSAAETTKNIGRNFSNLHQQIMDAYTQDDPLARTGMRGTFNAYLQAILDRPDYTPGVAGAGADLMESFGRTNGDGAVTYAGTGAAAAGTSEFGEHIGKGWQAAATGAAVGGVLGATGGAITPAENEDERNRNIVLGALGAGAAIGAATPTLIWGSKLMFRAMEEGLRKTAVHTAMKPKMVGAHEAVIDAMRGQAPRQVETIARDVSRAGEAVESAEYLYGQPIAEVVPPGATGSEPWATPIKGQRPTTAEALTAQAAANREGTARLGATAVELQGRLNDYRDALMSTYGSDILRNRHLLSARERQVLNAMERGTLSLSRGQKIPEDVERITMSYFGALPDLSQHPLRIGDQPRGLVLVAEPPAGALDRVEEFMRGRVDDENIMRVSPQEIAEYAIHQGVDAQDAHTIAGLWDGVIREGERAGHALANRIHGDYGDVSRLTEWLRRSGMFPFLTWGVKMAPNMATWIFQDPRLLIAIDRLNNISEEELDEAGLPARYDRLGRTGELGDAMAEQLLGRPDVSVMANVAGAINPYAEMGKLTATPEQQAPGYEPPPLQGLTNALSAFGLTPGPIPSLLGRATGLTEDYGSPLFRTSSYGEALSGIGGGPQVQPEQLPINIIRAAREGLTGKRQPTITGSPTLDYAVRQRIAEMAYEKTGKAPTGVYKQAMDDPKSAIWKQARRETETRRSFQMGLSSTLPFRTKTISDTETAVAAARLRSGTRTEDLAGLPPEQVAARFNQARASDPMALVLSGLGGTEEQTMDRQVGAYFEENERAWKRMTPQRRYEAQTAYLKNKPLLERRLGERGWLPRKPQTDTERAAARRA